MDDLISRQAAIDALKHAWAKGLEPTQYLEELPSAQPEWNNHTVACLLAELFDDTCACNHNGIDEWLPEKCELLDSCPHPAGVACWEQFLKYKRKGEPMSDLISRQAAIEIVDRYNKSHMILQGKPMLGAASIVIELEELPSAQPEVIRCKDCIYYDPPHVENNGVRYEYDEMPADAFDALGTGLVNAEYGINIGGRCCVDYYCKNYSDDKRVFVREDNYCGRAERRTDGSD